MPEGHHHCEECWKKSEALRIEAKLAKAQLCVDIAKLMGFSTADRIEDTAFALMFVPDVELAALKARLEDLSE